MPEDKSEKRLSSESRSIADRLRDLLSEQFGDDWRRDISLTLRADTLYWFVFLAERGIAAKRQDFKGDKDVASAVASLASWTMDLEALLNKIQTTFPPKKSGKNSK
jgi:hypothetical protein